jgi:hypothetical protein
MEVIGSIIMAVTQFTRDLSSLFVLLFPPYHSCHPTTKSMYKLVSSFPYLCSLHMNGNVEATLGFHHYVPKGTSIQLLFIWLLPPNLISKERVTLFVLKNQLKSTHFSHGPPPIWSCLCGRVVHMFTTMTSLIPTWIEVTLDLKTRKIIDSCPSTKFWDMVLKINLLNVVCHKVTNPSVWIFAIKLCNWGPIL